MSAATYLVGDVRAALATIPDGSIDLVLTSPPFLALRAYLPADHPDKALEIGSEPTPAAFLATLLGLTAEWRRVLAPHGSICVELGDTYAGSGGSGGDYLDGGSRAGQNGFTGSARRDRADQPREWAGGGDDWPLPKSLCMIPEAYRMALAYGRCPLTGIESPAGRWKVRNVVRWCRPNPPVGALGDKFRPGTSDMVIACTSRTRYFDLDAVRHMTDRHASDVDKGTGKRHGGFGHDVKRNHNHGKSEYANSGNPAGAPPLDWWEIPTQPYSGSHYAVWPPALLDRPIKAMCPQKVCTVCGEPSRRIVERDGGAAARGRPVAATGGGREAKAGRLTVQEATGRHLATSPTRTVGWSDCGHGSYRCSCCQLAAYECPGCGGSDVEYVADHWRNGIVLDPFAGSGTTLMVATGHGRDAIGIDLDARNVDLARERVGMFLTDVHHLTEAAS